MTIDVDKEIEASIERLDAALRAIDSSMSLKPDLTEAERFALDNAHNLITDAKDQLSFFIAARGKRCAIS